MRHAARAERAEPRSVVNKKNREIGRRFYTSFLFADDVFLCIAHRLDAVVERVVGLASTSATSTPAAAAQIVPWQTLVAFADYAFEFAPLANALLIDKMTRVVDSQHSKWTTIFDVLERLVIREDEIEAAIAKLNDADVSSVYQGW